MKKGNNRTLQDEILLEIFIKYYLAEILESKWECTNI